MPYHELEHEIVHYFNRRRLVWPTDADTALQFALTEMAEATELLLARKANWKRNNPGEKPAFDKDALAEEFGDIAMMVIVAGLVEGLSPLTALQAKMKRKLGIDITQT